MLLKLTIMCRAIPRAKIVEPFMAPLKMEFCCVKHP